MNHPFYEFTASTEALRYDFCSSGHRLIHKVIIYQKLRHPEIYNLALGDIDGSGRANYNIISDNGDRDHILATVIQTMIVFFEQYPTASVFIAGSTPSRTRLYQVVIARELIEIEKRFEVNGIRNSQIEPFRVGESYEAFVISLKRL